MDEQTKAPVKENAPEGMKAPAPEQIPEETKAPEKTPKEIKAEKRLKAHKRRMKALRDLLIRLVSLVLVVYVLFFHLVGITLMPNADMYPRVDAGDLLLFYRLERAIHAQDIVVFEKPTAMLDESFQEAQLMQEEPAPEPKPWWRQALNFLGFADPSEPPKTRMVCRVVAGPGDTVQVTDSERLVVNGNTMVESNIFYSTPMYGTFVTYPLTLGADEYFVLADSRTGGMDSRFFGPVKKSEIVGTVITILRRNKL